MKNRTKTISLLLAVCMMITLLPTVAFAKGMENVRIKSIDYHSNGWLSEVKILFDVRNSGKALTNFGIHKNHEFKESTTTDPTYGDFTNFGDYAENHDYNNWTQDPPDCNFIAWDSDATEYERPGDSSNNEVTIHFAANDAFNKDEAATYYVYAWTQYGGEIYPDVMVCSFSVNNSGTLVQSYPVSFDANGGTGSMIGQGFVPGEEQKLKANTFTRTDYTFTGWNTKADGTGVSYGDEAAFKLDANATSGLTLFAQWKAKETSAPGTVAPGTSSGIDLWYNGGNSFGSSNSAVPTSVEIDNLPVPFTGNGREFTVGCISPNAKWVTVNWNSTSVTTNFTPDANATCAEISLPKTGSVSVLAFALMAVVAAAGAMGKK